jgi:hypothetical protein
MYSKQGALLQQFYEALEPRAADAMFALLGQCQHDLEHRGRLSILNTLPASASGAVVTVANYPIPPHNYKTQYPSNGLAMEVFGKAKFNGVVEFAQEQIGAGAIPAGAMWMWVGAIGDIPAGWAIMDGTANSVGNGGSGIDMRGYLPMQYTGSGDFANIGDTVAADLATTFSGTGNVTTSTDGSHTHELSEAAFDAVVTINTPALTHVAGTSFSTALTVFGVDDTPSQQVFDGTTAPDSNYDTADGEVTISGHRHAIAASDVVAAISNHSATACTTSFSTNLEIPASGDHSHTVSRSLVAAGLSIGTPSTIRPPGKVVAFIEKLAA